MLCAGKTVRVHRVRWQKRQAWRSHSPARSAAAEATEVTGPSHGKLHKMWCWLLTPLVIQSAGINKVRKLTPGTGCQGLTGGRLEAKLFLALDLYHLTVMQGNFHSAKLQILQGLGNRSGLFACRNNGGARLLLRLCRPPRGLQQSLAMWPYPLQLWHWYCTSPGAAASCWVALGFHPARMRPTLREP